MNAKLKFVTEELSESLRVLFYLTNIRKSACVTLVLQHLEEINLYTISHMELLDLFSITKLITPPVFSLKLTKYSNGIKTLTSY